MAYVPGGAAYTATDVKPAAAPVKRAVKKGKAAVKKTVKKTGIDVSKVETMNCQNCHY